MKTLDKQHKVDTQVAAAMTTAALISDQGIQSVSQVLKGAKDPVQALAHVIFMALGKVREMLQQKGLKIDDKVWIAGGGVLDRVMFELMTVLVGVVGYKQAGDPTFVHDVKDAVLQLMQQDDEQGESPQEEQGESPEQEQQEPEQLQGASASLGAPQQAGGMQ
jgi:hypothetical protein